MIIASSSRSPSGVDTSRFGAAVASRWTDEARRRGRRSPRSATTAASVRACRRRAPDRRRRRAPPALPRPRFGRAGRRRATPGPAGPRSGPLATPPTSRRRIRRCCRRAARPGHPGSKPPPLQLPGQVVDQSHQVAVADRHAIGGDDERRRLRPPGCRRLDQIGDARARGFIGLRTSVQTSSRTLLPFLGCRTAPIRTMPSHLAVRPIPIRSRSIIGSY